MFGRVTALHFSVFLPSLGEIVPLTAPVEVDERGDLVPREVYRQGSGDEVSAEERVRAGEHAADACAMVQDLAVSASDALACALRAVVEAEETVFAACAEAGTAARAAGLLPVSWPLDAHREPGRSETPGTVALERYVAHIAEIVVPAAMLQKAEEAQEVWALERAEAEAEYLAEQRAEARADRLADGF